MQYSWAAKWLPKLLELFFSLNLWEYQQYIILSPPGKMFTVTADWCWFQDLSWLLSFFIIVQVFTSLLDFYFLYFPHFFSYFVYSLTICLDISLTLLWSSGCKTDKWQSFQNTLRKKWPRKKTFLNKNPVCTTIPNEGPRSKKKCSKGRTKNDDNNNLANTMLEYLTWIFQDACQSFACQTNIVDSWDRTLCSRTCLIRGTCQKEKWNCTPKKT